MSDADDVFQAERAAARRWFWKLPLGLVLLLAAFLACVYLLLLLEIVAHGLAGAAGYVGTLLGFVLNLVFIAVTFLNIPQALLVTRLGVRNIWVRLLTGAISGWMFLFARGFDSILTAAAATDRSAAGVSTAFLRLILDMPQLLAAFARQESRVDLVFFGALGAVLLGLAWRPMFRFGNKRDWDDPVLGGRPPYAR